jgi:exosortase
MGSGLMSLPSIRLLGPRAAAVRDLPLRAAALVGLVLLAYNYSLMTLARGLTLQTPLAYLALVPVIAIVLAAIRLRVEPPALPIHDRQLDWIVGLGLLAIAATVLVLLPDSTTATSSTFWLRRVDLLTLPLFVSGLIALLFGVRRMWALKVPIAFLLLAWPVPFTLLLGGTMDLFTDATARLVGVVTLFVPVAHPSAADPTLFIIGNGRQAFAVSIGSACAGVNSFVGFLLIGTAMIYAVRGPVGRRLLWLAIGLAIVFGLNVLRIVAILVVGATMGQAAALDILHPVAGLIVFNVGVLLMVSLVPRFGLWFFGGARKPGETPLPDSAPVRRARPAFVVAAAIALALAVTNAGYARFEAISSGLADARLTTFDIRTAQVPSWKVSFVGKFIQVKQFFGPTANWQRVLYAPTAQATLQSNRTVYVDVITTDDPGTFAAYGLEACYTFHGYDIASVSTVDIGAGVDAQVIDYHKPQSDTDWSAIWWEWPFTDHEGTHYERIVAFMAGGPGATFGGVPSATIPTQSPRFVQTDQFLTALGRTIVLSQLGRSS